MATSPQQNDRSVQYNYSVLPRGKYVRYLRLTPGKCDQPLKGNLAVEHINSLPSFHAISYVWGSSVKVDQIQCDGGTIRITASLQDVLRRVRLTSSVLNVWADQICINQDDLTERNNQVTLMGDIYAKSMTTLVWLGDAEISTTKSVSSLILDVNDMIETQLAQRNGSWDDLPDVATEDAIASDHRWEALAKMMTCEWFNRVWVVQEAGLSKNPRILYGNCELSWELCFKVLIWMRHRGRLIAYNFHIEWHAIHLDRPLIWKHPNSSNDSSRVNLPGYDWSFLEVLEYSRQLKASNPRDHIYAFLGHPSAVKANTKELIVSPNYEADTAEVNYTFARRWLEWTNDLNILSFVQHSSSTAKTPAVPSWVPSWNAFEGSVLSQLGESIFCAGKSNKDTHNFVSENRGLEVRGVIFDKIYYQSRIFEDKEFQWGKWNENEIYNSQSPSKWRDIFSHVLDSCSPCAYGSSQRFQAMSLTLAGPQYTDPLPEFERRAAAYLLSHLEQEENSTGIPCFLADLANKASSGDCQQFEIEIAAPCINRRFGITANGLYGLVPAMTQVGDLCCVIFGARTPFIIRQVSISPKCYELVGEGYIHGVMKGEIIEQDSFTESMLLFI
jgi:heterokaryon incompatibility protein (HET)